MVGNLSFVNSKLNTSISITANVTYVDEVDKKKVEVWIRLNADFNRYFKFQQTTFRLFCTKSLTDTKYIKLYDFTYFHCNDANANRLMKNQYLKIGIDIMASYNITNSKCPAPIGKNYEKNVTIPVSSLPLMGMKRKVKVTSQMVGRKISNKKIVSILNCTLFANVW